MRSRRSGSWVDTSMTLDGAGQTQIVLDRERAENVPSLGDEIEPGPSPAKRGKVCDVLILQQNVSFGRRQRADDGFQERGLASAVCTEQPAGSPPVDRETDVVEHAEAAVSAGKVLDAKHRVHASAPR